jgi:hypothetical protein
MLSYAEHGKFQARTQERATRSDAFFALDRDFGVDHGTGESATADRAMHNDNDSVIGGG